MTLYYRPGRQSDDVRARGDVSILMSTLVTAVLSDDDVCDVASRSDVADDVIN